MFGDVTHADLVNLAARSRMRTSPDRTAHCRIYANIGAKSNLIILLMRIFKYKFFSSSLIHDNVLITRNIELYTLAFYLFYEIILNNTYNFWCFLQDVMFISKAIQF